MRMPTIISALASGAALFCCSSLFGLTSDPAGYLTTVIPAKSDGVFSAALHQAPEYTGDITAISGGNTIELESANFTSNQFANSHYALISSGDREGLWAAVSGNDGKSLNLSLVNQDLGDVAGDRVEVGDTVKIIPFWTPATLITKPAVPAGTELLVFSRNVAGINVSAVSTYRYIAEAGWYDGPEEANDKPIYPDESVVLRNRSDAPLRVVQFGNAPMSAFVTVVSAVTEGVQQDIRLTSGLPVSIAIQDLIDPGAAGDGDQILIFDHQQPGENKEPLFTATYVPGSGWFEGQTNRNNYQLQKGYGFIYRKAAANSGDLVIRHKPSYQN